MQRALKHPRTGMRRSGWRATSALAAMVVLATVFCPAAQPAGAQLFPTPPAQPTTGPGANGPCTQTRMSAPNPAVANNYITVYSPGGSAATPTVGGTCGDARRPVVAVVHGLGAGTDAQLLGGDSLLYAELITHLVSVGNVVIFATYNTDTNDFVGSYRAEDAAIAAAATMTPRGDFSRFGIVGHSMGGGATPYLAQQAAARGWGSQALWLLPVAPWYVHGVGTGPVTVPAHTRAVLIAYDNDTYVDNRIGIDLYGSLTIPATQKQHVTVRSQTRWWFTTLNAQHTAANSLLAPNDAIRFFGLYRIADALQSCALAGAGCATDLGYMGHWSDGAPVTPAISTDNPTDSGPVTSSLGLFGLNGECTAPANPRAANCGT
jgi:hypothetical protein